MKNPNPQWPEIDVDLYMFHGRKSIKIPKELTHLGEITMDAEFNNGKVFGLSPRKIEKISGKKFDVIKFEDYNDDIMKKLEEKHWVRVAYNTKRGELDIQGANEDDVAKALNYYIKKFHWKILPLHVDVRKRKFGGGTKKSMVFRTTGSVKLFLKNKRFPSNIAMMQESNAVHNKVTFPSSKVANDFLNTLDLLGFKLSATLKEKTVLLSNIKKKRDWEIIKTIIDDYGGTIELNHVVECIQDIVDNNNTTDSCITVDDANKVIKVFRQLNETSRCIFSDMVQYSDGINNIVTFYDKRNISLEEE